MPQRKLEPSPNTLENIFNRGTFLVSKENRKVNAKQTKAWITTLSNLKNMVSAVTSDEYKISETIK